MLIPEGIWTAQLLPLILLATSSRLGRATTIISGNLLLITPLFWHLPALLLTSAQRELKHRNLATAKLPRAQTPCLCPLQSAGISGRYQRAEKYSWLSNLEPLSSSDSSSLADPCLEACGALKQSDAES